MRLVPVQAREPRDEISYPRNDISGTQKMHLDGFSKIP